MKIFAKLLLAIFCVYLVLVLADAILERQKNIKLAATNTPSFATQYLHPYYFFSFPTKKNILDKINSKDSWVDDRGYRGEGPEARGNRKLAFIIGGSTAFGDKASSNKNSISGVLNEIQSEYFFVNAGVPSWVSFQELLRFLKQISAEKPVLVVALNGFNDAATSYYRLESEIPPDAPESFEILNEWVENISSEEFREEAVGNYVRRNSVRRFFYLKNVLFHFAPSKNNANLHDTPNSGFEWPDHDKKIKDQANKAAKKYIENIRILKETADLKKIDYIAFFQPFKFAGEKFKDKKIYSMNFGLGAQFRNYYLMFREAAFRLKPSYLKDISESFNQSSDDDSVMPDSVHFTDKGYAQLAQLMWVEIQVHLKNKKK